MPGIAGIFSKNPKADRGDLLKPMLASMLHEPFYKSGSLIDRQLGVAVAWTTHPNSFTDCLPIWNEKKDICLILAGEDFSDPSEIDRLRAQGHSFEPGGASYLVHLYEEDEDGFFRKLNGWFSGVLLDLRERKAVLFNDRYALRRIYLHEDDQALYFASEAKALLKGLPRLRELDERGL